MYGWSRECNLCGYQYVQTCTNIHNVYVHVDPKKKTNLLYECYYVDTRNTKQ